MTAAIGTIEAGWAQQPDAVGKLSGGRSWETAHQGVPGGPWPVRARGGFRCPAARLYGLLTRRMRTSPYEHEPAR